MKPPPTIEELRHAFDYDCETGLFTWRNPTPKSRAKLGAVTGHRKPTGYIALSLNARSVWAHRAAWAHYHGEWPSGFVDHINQDKSDNRICNLRVADRAENNWNRRSKSDVTGASLRKGGRLWKAFIRHRGERFFLGNFQTKDEAAAAYQRAATSLRGVWHE